MNNSLVHELHEKHVYAIAVNIYRVLLFVTYITRLTRVFLVILFVRTYLHLYILISAMSYSINTIHLLSLNCQGLGDKQK